MEMFFCVLLIIFECIEVYICLHICFQRRVRFCKTDLFYYIVYISYYIMVNVMHLWLSMDILFAGIIYLWCLKKFGRTVWKTIQCYLLGIAFSGVVQMTSAYILEPINQLYFSGHTMAFLGVSGFAGCVIVLILYKIIWRKNKNHKMVLPGKYIILTVLLMIAVMLFVKMEYDKTKTLNPYLYGISYFLLLLVLLGAMREQRIKQDLKRQAIELEMTERYGSIYDATLTEIRYKQHDYNNQISTLLSMHHIAKNLDELKIMQNDYVGQITQNNEYSSILKSRGNPILIGYIYNIYQSCLNEKIRLDAEVNLSEDKYNIPTYKLVEILGILIDNAREYYREKNIIDKEIKLVLRDDGNKIVLEVLNYCHKITNAHVESMFRRGYSTKGANRGLGLASMKEIIMEYDGDIMVENCKIDSENWIKIRVDV